jgi:ATP-dependent RNA helicase SUPV3L1/SUV3
MPVSAQPVAEMPASETAASADAAGVVAEKIAPDTDTAPVLDATAVADVADDVTPDVLQPVEASSGPETSAPALEAPPVDAPVATGAAEAQGGELPASDAPPVSDAVVPTPAEAAVPATPELVEVWRPAGRSDERRPRQDRSHHKPSAQAVTPADGVAAPVDERQERPARGRRHRNRDDHRPQAGVAADAVAVNGEAALPKEARSDHGRPPRERSGDRGAFKGNAKDRGKGKFDKGKFDRGGRDSRDNRGDRDRSSYRTYATSAAPRDNRAADPNSPFAKLAALKDQLAADRKD